MFFFTREILYSISADSSSIYEYEPRGDAWITLTPLLSRPILRIVLRIFNCFTGKIYKVRHSKAESYEVGSKI